MKDNSTRERSESDVGWLGHASRKEQNHGEEELIGAPVEVDELTRATCARTPKCTNYICGGSLTRFVSPSDGMRVGI